MKTDPQTKNTIQARRGRFAEPDRRSDRRGRAPHSFADVLTRAGTNDAQISDRCRTEEPRASMRTLDPGHLPDDVFRRTRLSEPHDDRETALPTDPLALTELRPLGNTPAGGTTPAARPELDPAFDKIVREVALLHDAHRRKRIALRLDVPGRGRLHVGIEHGTHGANVTFRAADPGLTDELRLRRGELVDRARRHRVAIAQVVVA